MSVVEPRTLSMPSSPKLITSQIDENPLPGSSKIKPISTSDVESSEEQASKILNQIEEEAPSNGDDDDDDDYEFLYSRNVRSHARVTQLSPQQVFHLPSLNNDDTLDVTPTNSTHRSVKDYKYSYGKSGKHHSRLIVPETCDKNLVRIYSNSFKGYFFCYGCNQVNFRKRLKARFDGTIFMAPLSHDCKPITMEDALSDGQKYKKKADKQKYGKDFVSDESNGENNDEKEEEDVAAIVGVTNILHPNQRDKRIVTAENYEFHVGGFSNDKFGKIIVYDEDDNRNLIREYRKDCGKSYYCYGCKQASNIRLRGILKTEIFYAPLEYLHSCEPKMLENFLQEQQEHVNRQNNPSKGGTSNSGAMRKRAKPYNPNATILTNKIARIDQGSSGDHDDDPNNPKNSRHVCETVFRYNKVDENVTVKNSVIDGQTNEQKDVSGPTNATTDINFFRCSEYFLRQTCKKFGIQDNTEGYDFCNKMKIKQIKSSSYPSVVHQTTESMYHGFSCFSLYLTGNESNTIIIREMINRYVYNNFKSLGECMGHDFSQFNHETPLIRETIWSNAMTEIHVEILSRWLQCRIGIYGNGAWKRYGNWNDKNSDIPTFIIEHKNGKYNPILELKD